ncbi:MAG TPA: hypothetical protein DCG47_07485, partial [Spirochaetaceae bacterium]|nr:hypothetical protein [Spirochaetaceae bacterium]
MISHKVWVTVNGAAQITAASATSTGLPAAGALVTLDANGLGWVRVTDAVAQAVTVSATTDGSSGSDDLPNIVANGTAALSFSLGPSLSSASASNFVAAGTQALPVITISNGGSALTNAANDLYLRVPSSIGLNFSAAAPAIGGTPAKVTGTSYTNPSTLYINLNASLAGAETLTLTGLQLVVPTNASSSGRLELSFDGGLSWTVIDTQTITVSTASTFTWDGGGGNANWTNALNWVGDIVPPSGANIDIPAATPQDPIVNTALPTFGSITIGAGKTVLTGTPGLSASGSVVIDGTMTGGAGALSFGGSVSGAGTLTASSGITTIGGSLTVTNFAANGGTFLFNGAAVQTTNAYTFNNLQKTGGATLALAGSTLTVSGTLSIATGSTFAKGAFNIAVTGSALVSGTLDLGGTGVITVGGNL